ncbi:CHAP domain-containing protein [Actinospica sp. MGRD01-02]|uniref:CHAP domain-containing protein n=1 Tax=Actinospica acidithermotolerans TaxID=2828514 RepID=A0A941E759_9ACTN|nr:CHAP domain-containing protein [Actinospica acidithermotolerans]MBR7825052.1 CHAP domain-containing protein [Actinospica acidithermotolerans]
MNIKRYIRRFAGAAVAILLLSLASALSAPMASAAAGGNAASLAAANLGKSAGYCADSPSTNSLGGDQFETSCSGNGGAGEFWCADFAEWVWQNSGFYTGGLTAAAGSFYVYGENNGTLHTSSSYVPQPGDAVVYDYAGGGSADHVGIVTSVDSSGNVVTANGDWNGISGSSQATFAESSSVVSVTIPASERASGDYVGAAGMTISGYVTPVASGSGNTPPPVSGANPYSPNAACGSGYGVIDSHALSGATIYLLYNSGNGDNCVVTLATTPSSAVSMNATLAVQGGASASNPGTFTYYAGPVTENAPSSCVEWGGSYKTSSWTSGWSHCGGGSGAPAPSGNNIYTPTQVCGSGYGVIDSHALSGATVYLLYNASTGDNCVTTLATTASGAVSMNATLAVQGGSSASNPGSFTYYAGPVVEYAPNSCVEWGGSYKTSSWTSSWSHCGAGGSPSGSTNPYTPTQVCGSGYGVVDSHPLSGATIYLLYNSSTGDNCVATMATSPTSAVSMNATLAVEGGSSASNPGTFTDYAGPVVEYAPTSCVEWGGSYAGSSWTSGWSHC